MKINISQKLGLSAALVVSIVGSFSESAEAGRFIFTGNSNNSVQADFILDTDQERIEELTLKNVEGKQFASSSIGGVDAFPIDRDELNKLVNGSLENDELLASEFIEYELTFNENNLEGLDDLKGTLYIPYRTESERNNLIDNLIAFDNAFATNPQIQDEGIPGILIRNFVEELDDEKQKIEIEGIDSIIEIFGVAGNSSPFKVTKQDIPEPTTAAGLLAVLAVGGLSLRKGDKLKGHGSSDRRVKSKAII